MFMAIKRSDERLLPELKNIIRPTGKKFRYLKSNDAHKLIACLMQRSESALMYQVVAPKLISENIRFVTIHDALILLPEHVPQAQRILQEAFESLSIPVPSISAERA